MQTDIVIVGGGLVGASLARALDGSGLSLALVEGSAPAPRVHEWDQRVYAISPASRAFLESLGAWRQLDPARVCAVQAMRVFGDDGASGLDFSAYEAGVGELAWIVESCEIAQALWRALEAQAQVSLLCPAAPAGLELREDAAVVRTEDGATIEARLLVGADGGHSWVRREAGFETQERAYGQRAVVANFACERAHHGAALQWFRSDGVLAWLPLAGERISMVWATSEEHAASLLATAPDELCVQVEQAGAGALGALRLLSPAAAFPLAMLATASMIGPRVALAGDAAHVVHPLAGQGVNLGFGDARELAAALRARPPGADPGDRLVLRAYERARAEDILAMRLVTDGLHRLFGAPGPWVARLRNLGLRLTDSVPFVKTFLARRAMN